MSQKKQEALSSWFQDLAGNKSLQALSRSKVSRVCGCVGVRTRVCMRVCFRPCGCVRVCVLVYMLLCFPSLYTDPTSDEEGRDI